MALDGVKASVVLHHYGNASLLAAADSGMRYVSVGALYASGFQMALAVAALYPEFARELHESMSREMARAYDKPLEIIEREGREDTAALVAAIEAGARD